MSCRRRNFAAQTLGIQYLHRIDGGLIDAMNLVKNERLTMPLEHLALFAGASLLMVLTPGPNMIYLVSRSICQGPHAGLISLLGVVTGFLLHMLAAAAGLTAVFLTIPLAYDVVKGCGVVYLLWLAWNAAKPGARSVFEARDLPHDLPSRLFVMGFFTNLLNPKIAMFYLAIFPQFLAPEYGSLFIQSLGLGLTQIAVSFTVNSAIILCAAGAARWVGRNPLWLTIQRYLMGAVLCSLAVKLAIQERQTG